MPSTPVVQLGARRPSHALAVLLAAVLWGTTGTVAHVAPAGSSALAIGLATFGIGGVVLAAISLRRVVAVLRRRADLAWLLAGAVGVVLYPAAYYPSMTLAGVAVGNVVALGSGPIFAALLEWAVDRRRPDARWTAATGIAVVGIVLLAVGGHGGGGASTGADAATGVALALLAGFGYALYAFAGARLIGRGASATGAMGALFLVGGLACLGWLAVVGLGPLASLEGAATIAYLALVPMALAYLLFGYALRAMPSSSATTLALAEPVVATLLAVLVVGERPTGIGWAGLVVVAVGIAMLAAPTRVGAGPLTRRGPRVGSECTGAGPTPQPGGDPSMTQQDPRTKHRADDFPTQQQPQQPGLTGAMDPAPDHGESSWVGRGRLEGRRALITGGDSGIGRAVAIAYAREGADVAIVHLPEEAEDAAETGRLVEAAGRRFHAMALDLTEEQACVDAVASTVAALGGLDILVSNAAYQRQRDGIEHIEVAEIERVFRTNLVATIVLAREAVPHLRPGSSIISTTSIQAEEPAPGLLDYAMTKAALVAFTEALAQELGPRGIRVNAVAPGPIWTPLIPATGFPDEKVEQFGQEETPLGRAGQPAELAGAYVYLASEEASYVSGAIVPVTGGRGF